MQTIVNTIIVAVTISTNPLTWFFYQHKNIIVTIINANMKIKISSFNFSLSIILLIDLRYELKISHILCELCA